jgi:plasmid maintenance system antidote protein VapI
MTRDGAGQGDQRASPVTTDTALLLAAYLGTGEKGAELLLGMQMDFDLWDARARMKARLAKIKPAPRAR